MIDSDKIVSLNSLVEHTDISVLKNISHVSGGPSSLASTGKTVVYPNKKEPIKYHKVGFLKPKIQNKLMLNIVPKKIPNLENSIGSKGDNIFIIYFILFYFLS